MSFQSPLAPVVRIRKLFHERKELELRLAHVRLASCLAQESLLEEVLRQYSRLSSELASSTPAVELHYLGARAQATAEKLAVVRQSTAEARAAVAKAAALFEESRRQLEQVETIHNQHVARWKERLDKREQLALDEMFLISWHRARQNLQPGGSQLPPFEHRHEDAAQELP